MNTNITYNRSLMQWEVATDAGIHSVFPPGDDGQQAAEMCKLKLDDPVAYAAAYYLAYDLFRGIQPLQDLIWRAAAIVAAGDVRPSYQVGEEPHTVARVKNQTKANTPQHNLHHIVKRSPHPNGRYTCDCWDFTNDSAPKVQGQKLCKHILAYKIMKVINREMQPWPALDPKIQWLRDQEAKKEAELEERRRQNKIAERRRVANRGENKFENARIKTSRGGEGAQRYALMAAANGAKTIPAHIYPQLIGGEETEKAKAAALAELFPEKYGKS
jgi:hypothetical protein